jgi:hypothetical protein
MSRSLLRLVSLVAVTLTAGCNTNNPFAVTPTAPTDPVTATFTGRVTLNGASTHTFSATTSGRVTATLSSLSPDATAVAGFAMGEWTGVSCVERIANDSAVQSTVITGNVAAAAQLCIRVRDVGRFTEPIDYEVTVVHP